jgi:predicted Rossmann-fold nucleotide-binding protein
MHQRKAEMARNSDAFVALPGTLAMLACFFLALDWILASSSC